MKRTLSIYVIGGFLVLVGLVAMVSWYWYMPRLPIVLPSSVYMVFNAAFSFFLVGLSLWFAATYPRASKYIYLACGFFIFCFAALILSQDLFHYTSGVDEWFVKSWLRDQNPFPGRMADSSALTFMVAGLALMLLPFTKTRVIAVIMQSLIFCIGLVGFSGIIGYLLKIEFLYGWYGYSHMAIFTTVCFACMGIGFWLVWQNSEAYEQFYTEKEDKKILLLSIIILFSIAFIAGLLGFAVTAKQNQVTIENFMQQSLANKINLLQESVSDAFIEMKNIVNNPLTEMQLSTGTGAANLLEDSHFSAMKMLNMQGKTVYSDGQFLKNPQLIKEFDLPEKTALYWNNGFFLRLSTGIYKQKVQVGTLLLEWPLSGFNAAFLGDQKGKTNQTFFLCKNDNITPLDCYPSSQSVAMKSLLSFSGVQQLSKMLLANQSGVLTGLDGQNKNILAAYAPVLLLKLGMIVKADTMETYSALRQQLYLVIPILFFIVVIGASLLYWRVLPLVQKMMRAKRQASLMSERLYSIMNHIAEGVMTFDERGIIEEFNSKASEIFGYSHSEIVGKHLSLLMPLNQDHDYRLGFDNYLQSDETLGNIIELSGVHKNGQSIDLEVCITEMQVVNRKLFVGIVRDVTDENIAKSTLLESENRFRSAFDSAAIGMALVSCEGRWLRVNSSLCEILGYRENELLGMDFQSIIISQDLERGLKKRQELMEKQIKYFQLEERYHHKSGRVLWLLISHSLVRSAGDAPLYFILQIQDITQQKISEEQLSYQAYYDSLTGLENRNQLEHNLLRLIETSRRNQQRFAVFFLDLDRFKYINDTFGHDAGDKVLKIVATRLTELTNRTDIVARLGGDEFVLVLSELANLESAATFAEKVINSLLEPIQLKENDFFISTSIGISFYPSDGADYQTLIKNADLALYQAKNNGRNNYQFCTTEMNKEFQKRVTLEKALTDALIHDEFSLNFQPQVDLASQTIVSLEALLRWQSRRYGAVSPQQIISIAEETGLIIPLGEWIFKTACKQIKSFHDEGFSFLKLAVNITPRQLIHDQLIQWVLGALKASHLTEKTLKLEVKESLILQAPEDALDKLLVLKDHGVGLVIDDFGTGYSSIKSLKDNIIDYVKIDQSLTQNIGRNDKDMAMIKGIIDLAKNLEVKVIAEGVETKEQYEFLLAAGCHEAQGYLFCPPIPSDEIVQFLRNWRINAVTK